MKKKDQEKILLKEANDKTYLIANLFIIFLMSLGITLIIWLYLPFWWIINFIITLFGIILCAWIEVRYLTHPIGLIVTELWPDPVATAELQERYAKEKEKKETEKNH